MKHSLFVAFFALLSAHAAAQDDAAPDIARAMLKAAAESGEPGDIDAVKRSLAAVFPDYVAAIDAEAARLIADIPVEETADEEEAATKLAEAGADTDPGGTGFFALRPWTGKLTAGASNSTGNSDNTAIGFALEAARETGKFTHNVRGYADFASAAGIETQQRWGASYKLDYLFSKRTYAFARVAYDEDEFSGFDYRLFTNAGLGHFIAKRDELTWKVEGGPGYSYSPIDITREVQSQVTFYAASETDWVIREGVKLEQDFRVNWTEPTTAFQSVTALTTSLIADIGAGVSYEVRYETNPPEGRVNTDTILRANLTYGF